MRPEALYIGRFQPFHNGHAHCLRYILSLERSLYIMIGSSNKSRTDENPFTTQERTEMLRSFLEENDMLDRCIIGFVPDFDTSNDRWFDEVIKKFPGVKRLYSNNERTRRIFNSKGLEVVQIPLLDRDRFSGTYIRSNRGEIDSLVPESSMRIIEKSDS